MCCRCHNGGAAADAAAPVAAVAGAAAAAGQWRGLGLASQQQARGYAHHAHRSDPYRTPPTNYVQLLQHIHTAKHMNRLDELLKDYGDTGAPLVCVRGCGCVCVCVCE